VHSNDSHNGVLRHPLLSSLQVEGLRTACTHIAGERDASVLASKTYVLDLAGRSEQGFS
jgi:hypothetical protein